MAHRKEKSWLISERRVHLYIEGQLFSLHLKLRNTGPVENLALGVLWDLKLWIEINLRFIFSTNIPHAKSWLIGKDFDAGRDWGQEKKVMTKDEMAGWHHWLDGRESEWTPDRETWRAAIHGVAKSRTRLSDWTELNWMIWEASNSICFSSLFNWALICQHLFLSWTLLSSVENGWKMCIKLL